MTIIVVTKCHFLLFHFDLQTFKFLHWCLNVSLFSTLNMFSMWSLFSMYAFTISSTHHAHTNLATILLFLHDILFFNQRHYFRKKDYLTLRLFSGKEAILLNSVSSRNWIFKYMFSKSFNCLACSDLNPRSSFFILRVCNRNCNISAEVICFSRIQGQPVNAILSKKKFVQNTCYFG